MNAETTFIDSLDTNDSKLNRMKCVSYMFCLVNFNLICAFLKGVCYDSKIHTNILSCPAAY